jgi:RNA polymerase sigma factor for flagellar operon FliA
MLAENDLVSLGLPVVAQVAKRIARRLGRRVEVDDLTAIGNLALVDVARKYDASRASFASYAAWRVKYAILDVLRRDTQHRSTASRAKALLASERLAETQAEAPEPTEPTTVEEDQAALTALLEEQAAALALGLLSGAPDAGMCNSPEEAAHRAEIAGLVKGVVGTLPDRERALIERHYYQGEQFDEIAADLGISKSWACRLHEKGIHAVKEAIAGLT